MADGEIPRRGRFQFVVDGMGDLFNSAVNVEALRKLWLDRLWINGDAIGPGDPGDFDNGAWHVSCHLAGAGGVRRTADGRTLWLEVSHSAARDEYYASVTYRSASGPVTLAIDSAEGRELLAGSTLLGFIEGNSTGRTSARGVWDPPTLFNLWRRQDCDQPVSSPADGGKVWEHWCTLRDIRPGSRIATSVLTAYVSLVAALGDSFPAAVARGRRDYGHPSQLCALVFAGFISSNSALWDTMPRAIAPAHEPLFLRADPVRSLEACETMDWSSAPQYYMFTRRIDRWNKAAEVSRDLEAFRKAAAF
ncbi:MAG: hypothetical protein ACM3U2_15720 [Deltaproteobacteria bacterium]